ncbi:unnamed protein product [Staurois parvus]|uniref:Uncharacterized protein n=1 Tax=Staurois parvus TaxID=386267 RepID=A0ABN9HJU9_9NEOB|nr:unnamed protein product [Staurois parvus]
MCPRYRLTIHKKHRFLRMRTWHPAVKPSAHTTQKPGRQRAAG